MARINDNFQKLPGSYLFSEIAHRVEVYRQSQPQAKVIRMGIGDVTLPLCDAVVKAMEKATAEMGCRDTFRGYGPEQGCQFLARTILDNDFTPRGIHLDTDEIFVSDGAKSDTGNIGDILGIDNVVAVTDPVYPVYVDTNVMAGRAGNLMPNGQWSNVVYMPCLQENGFVPELPKVRVDVIYLCFPNNPTGTTLTKAQLKTFVDYARNNDALIMFDAAYEAFITENDVPHSIYEIEGAKEVAIEFRSFSKTAGFTGTRCGYTVIPKEVMAYDEKGNSIALNHLWNRRQCTKFNGTPYVVQRGAEAIYSEEGKIQVRSQVDYYMTNASIIRNGLQSVGYDVFGGINGPYVWVKTPEGMSSWSFFDHLLKDKNIVVTPGVGFGPSGEGYVRFSALGDRDNTIEAMCRLQ